MFVAADVHDLPSGSARAAAVVAADPAFSRLAGERTVVVADVAPYQPGQFYLRELPPLHAVLDGLSAQARDEFGVPVIGVAKTPFRTATHAIAALRRADTLARHGPPRPPRR
ncbi:MAG TPA: hypothetical protein VFE59_20400 [Trebonia sp.]|nr:hypothetical protein [Trebonia sp.]